MLLLCNTWVLAHHANCFLRLCFPQLRILYDHRVLLLLTTEYFLQSQVNLTGFVNLGSFITGVGYGNKDLLLFYTRKLVESLIRKEHDILFVLCNTTIQTAVYCLMGSLISCMLRQKEISFRGLLKQF